MAKRQELLHQILSPFTGRLHDLEILRDRAAGRRLGRRQLRKSQDRGQHVIKLMGNAAGQSANGVHFFHLFQLGFKFLN